MKKFVLGAVLLGSMLPVLAHQSAQEDSRNWTSMDEASMLRFLKVDVEMNVVRPDDVPVAGGVPTAALSAAIPFTCCITNQLGDGATATELAVAATKD